MSYLSDLIDPDIVDQLVPQGELIPAQFPDASSSSPIEGEKIIWGAERARLRHGHDG